MAAGKSFDAIVIGSGSVGTPAAYSLAEAGVRTLVLDRFPSPGQGSNKAAIGGLRATHSDPAKIRLCLRSLDIFANWKERHGDDLEWHKGGYSYVAYRPEEEKILKDLLVVQKSYGLNISWLDREEILEAIPGINPDGLVGGTLSPDDGNASPLLAVQAFHSHARRLGAEFRFGETVIGLDLRRRPGPRRPDRQGDIRRGGRHQRRRAAGPPKSPGSPGSTFPSGPTSTKARSRSP